MLDLKSGDLIADIVGTPFIGNNDILCFQTASGTAAARKDRQQSKLSLQALISPALKYPSSSKTKLFNRT